MSTVSTDYAQHLFASVLIKCGVHIPEEKKDSMTMLKLLGLAQTRFFGDKAGFTFLLATLFESIEDDFSGDLASEQILRKELGILQEQFDCCTEYRASLIRETVTLRIQLLHADVFKLLSAVGHVDTLEKFIARGFTERGHFETAAAKRNGFASVAVDRKVITAIRHHLGIRSFTRQKSKPRSRARK